MTISSLKDEVDLSDDNGYCRGYHDVRVDCSKDGIDEVLGQLVFIVGVGNLVAESIVDDLARVVGLLVALRLLHITVFRFICCTNRVNLACNLHHGVEEPVVSPVLLIGLEPLEDRNTDH